MLDDLDTLVGAYRLDAAGYDAGNARLTDHGPFGHHLALGGTGGPVLAARDGHECMDFDGSWWFEGRNPLLGGGSLALLMVVDGAAADPFLAPVNTLERRGSPANRAASPPQNPDTDWFSSSYQGHGVTVTGQSTRLRARVGNPSPASTATLPRGSLAFVAFALSGDPAAHVMALNDAPATTDAYGDPRRAVPLGSHMRIGHLKATPGLQQGRYLALKRAWFLRGNVFDHPEFEAARATELARWGIA